MLYVAIFWHSQSQEPRTNSDFCIAKFKFEALGEDYIALEVQKKPTQLLNSQKFNWCKQKKKGWCCWFFKIMEIFGKVDWRHCGGCDKGCVRVVGRVQGRQTGLLPFQLRWTALSRHWSLSSILLLWLLFFGGASTCITVFFFISSIFVWCFGRHKRPVWHWAIAAGAGEEGGAWSLSCFDTSQDPADPRCPQQPAHRVACQRLTVVVPKILWEVFFLLLIQTQGSNTRPVKKNKNISPPFFNYFFFHQVQRILQAAPPPPSPFHREIFFRNKKKKCFEKKSLAVY